MVVKLPGIWFFCLLFAGVPANAQVHRALIISIGNYPEAGGWDRISSLNDIPYIQNILERNGFRENTVLLTDREATATGIDEAFKKLVSQASRGDKIVIHVSAHGEQVADDNGDETDGLDECIVAYDAISPGISTDFNKDQAAYFRDDQLDRYISQLQTKLGKEGDITVFIDACHSGTGTRGIAQVRGGKPPFVPAGYIWGHTTGKEDQGLYNESNAFRHDPSDLANYVVIAAARADELDHEIKDDNNKPVGPLTYALSKTFSTLNPQATYRSLFAGIQVVIDQKIVSGNQHAVLEGTGLDRVVWGGDYVPYTAAIALDSIKGKRITVRAGKLSGLEKGARVALYRSQAANLSDSSLLISYGSVLEAGIFTAVIGLDKMPPIKSPAEGKVFITGPVYKIKPVRIGLINFSQEEEAAVSNGLRQLPVVSIRKDAELYLVRGAEADSVKMASNGSLFQTVKGMATNTARLRTVIQQYSQYKFLKSLNINQHDPRFNVEILLVPVINGKPDTTMIAYKKESGIYRFYENDSLVLWIKNKTYDPLYINILDLQPDGIINKILPNKEQKIYPADLKLEAESSYLFSKYMIRLLPPYGNEVFKVFVSDREIDMEEIAGGRGNANGNLGFLETLLKDSYNLSSRRGGENISLAGANGSTYDILFEIKEKNNARKDIQ